MTILKMEWRTNRKGLLLWLFVIILVLSLFMSVFPTMQTEVMKEMVQLKLADLPENMLKIFHLQSGPSLLEPVGYFGYVFQYIFIAACVYATLLGSQALIKEETNGTIEFLNAQPVSRSEIVRQKLLANGLIITFFWLLCFISALGTLLLFANTEVPFRETASGVFKILAVEYVILLFLLFLGMCLSSVIKSANQAVSYSLGIVFGLYLLGILGDLKENLAILKILSPVAQGNPGTLLAHDFPVVLVVILASLSLLLYFLSGYFYGKKDFVS